MAANLKSTGGSSAYHHGDLRPALLKAAERELTETGIEGFSLRGVAKRAGVSHAAPTHHFKDASGLLTALAAIGFEKFVVTQRAHQSRTAPDQRSQLLAAGTGYICFAMKHPALFHLMFTSSRPDFTDDHLRRAAEFAYAKLATDVDGHSGGGCGHAAETNFRIAAAWALVHGIAGLVVAKRLKFLDGVPAKDRAKMITRFLNETLIR
jgi:AcrR family transcriptional regulator